MWKTDQLQFLHLGTSEGVKSKVIVHSFPRADTVATFLPWNVKIVKFQKHFIFPSLAEYL